MFIGDSIVEGLLAYNVVGNADVFAYIGINPKTIQQKKFVERDGKTLTVVDAVRGQSYDKAYVMIGANGVSWLTKKTFTREYEKFLDELIEVMPDTIIYVQSMLPVLESKLKGEDRAITNELIIEYNDALQEMVATKPSTVIYLDLWPAFAVDGSLTSQDAEPDGVHLRMKAYKRWVSYLHEIT